MSKIAKVKKVLRDWDPEGLIDMDCPIDEYDDYAYIFIGRALLLPLPEDLAKHMAIELNTAFYMYCSPDGRTHFSKQPYTTKKVQPYADQIWKIVRGTK